jgi:hypothetical protein
MLDLQMRRRLLLLLLLLGPAGDLSVFRKSRSVHERGLDLYVLMQLHTPDPVPVERIAIGGRARRQRLEPPHVSIGSSCDPCP